MNISYIFNGKPVYHNSLSNNKQIMIISNELLVYRHFRLVKLNIGTLNEANDFFYLKISK